MTTASEPVIRVASAGQQAQILPAPQEVDSWKGFGSIPGETPEEFHDRMYDLDPLEAMILEMDFEAQRLEASFS